MIKRLPRTINELQEFCKIKGLRLNDKIPTKNGDIYIAETDLEMDNRREFPWGYYQVFYVITNRLSKGKFLCGRWMDFDAMHDKDKGWSTTEKRNARLRAVEAEARKIIEVMKNEKAA